MNFYKLKASEQKEISVKNLIKYIQEYVYPYHPYYRKNINNLKLM
jgi:hypothetical protein